jgi:hypothetical protein
MVQMFIKHVLGVNSSHPGYYGKTDAYYGTVEQQGRLTLHLHMMIWIENSLSPQEIRERLMGEDSTFKKSIVEYLEGCHQGELSTGTLNEVKNRITSLRVTPNTSLAGAKDSNAESSKDVRSSNTTTSTSTTNYSEQYTQDPTLTLPVPPPLEHSKCGGPANQCKQCSELDAWWNFYNNVTDELLARSNTHTCRTQKDVSDSNQSKGGANNQPKGCLDKNGICRARFPRDTYPETVIDEDGHIDFKKMEENMNTFSTVLTYLCRCNTDVTSLLSGTTVKAVVSYVTDYITKPSLKSYQIFSTAYDIYQKDAAMLTADNTKADAARKILMKMTNSITSKMEVGSPMASMYLLGNPDHYKSHNFVPFWWRSFVSHISRAEGNGYNEDDESDKVLLTKNETGYAAWCNVDDYIYRPKDYNDISLYDWIQCHVKIKKRARQSDNDADDDVEEEDHNGNKASADAYTRFLLAHSQYNTHQVKVDPCRRITHIPNFLGGALPRKDQGDSEFYCKTMLMLFKPWRTINDLKDRGSKWEESFNAFSFNVECTKLMQNFNVRYECLDERDDYHAIMKQKVKTARLNFNNWEEYEDDDEDDELNELLKTLSDEADLASALEVKGSKTRRYERELDAANAIAKRMNLVNSILSEAYPVLEYVSSSIKVSTWKSIVRTARAKLIKERQKTIPEAATASSANGGVGNAQSQEGDVKLLDISYITKDFQAKVEQEQQYVDDLVKSNTLNTEQERAFRIVANHISSKDVPPLRMYLGGMGGTGKSQVIKAIKELFEKRKESHRFIVLAPTGTAAALLNGSTYHSILGLRSADGDDDNDVPINEATTMMNARERLSGVEYIFLDECSMLSCKDIYNICARLAQIRGCYDESFGGFNVIFAGDFAQLPPVGADANLFSNKTKRMLTACATPWEEAALVGKFLWHQFTTVVILTKNMRQTDTGSKEALFRDALVNMRYASCTDTDMNILRSLIAQPHSPRLMNDLNFRNTSIITARNRYKDEFNRIGCERFARDIGQPLYHFYSIDSLLPVATPNRKRKRNKKKNSNHQVMTESVQRTIWEISPTSTKHFAGKLSLCLGMPVMIRYNDATELCITKGQEAIVVGWNAIDGPYNMPVLETLFVKLVNPPRRIKLDSLPYDVVPIPRRAETVPCIYTDDRELRIKREQVTVLPNFGMTDYASQGKTREYNVVELTKNKDYHGIYTSLSRGRSAEGTIILGEFEENVYKITQGIKGDLKQEFRELNMLDQITHQRYEGTLEKSVAGDLRYPLIQSYLLTQKVDDVTKGWHDALKTDSMNELMPDRPEEPDTDSRWSSRDAMGRLKADKETHEKVVANQKKTKAQGDNNKKDNAKRKDLESLTDSKSKRVRTLDNSLTPVVSMEEPEGIIWDRVDYSCAYDSLLVVLYHMWKTDPVYWQRYMANKGIVLKTINRVFDLIYRGVYRIETGRDEIRISLRNMYPDRFPAGSQGIFISDLIPRVFPEDACGNSVLSCSGCNIVLDDTHRTVLSYVTVLCKNNYLLKLLGRPYTISEALYSEHTQVRPKCTVCGAKLSKCMLMFVSPEFICFGMEDDIVKIELQMMLPSAEEGVNDTYRLRGAIYGGQEHFTARVIDHLGQVWYADGLANQKKCIFEKTMMMNEDTDWIKVCNEKLLVYLMYENVTVMQRAQNTAGANTSSDDNQ